MIGSGVLIKKNPAFTIADQLFLITGANRFFRWFGAAGAA